MAFRPPFGDDVRGSRPETRRSADTPAGVRGALPPFEEAAPMTTRRPVKMRKSGGSEGGRTRGKDGACAGTRDGEGTQDRETVEATSYRGGGRGGGADCGAAGAQTFPTTSAAAAIVKTRGHRLSSCGTGGWVGGWELKTVAARYTCPPASASGRKKRWCGVMIPGHPSPRWPQLPPPTRTHTPGRPSPPATMYTRTGCGAPQAHGRRRRRRGYSR